MNPLPKIESLTDSRRSRLAWLCLLSAICWSVLLRVPLIENAAAHLDSDLAVDGLTLREAVEGRWRWHYPGTPHTGIGSVLLSLPQARIWGAGPMSLVSGGTVAHVFLIVAVFSLGWRVFGRGVAVGSLVPLTFASTGVLWLSGRITGGHLLIVAWTAVAWVLVHEAWVRRGWLPSAVLGFWCGLGVYLDSMFVLTLAGIAFAALIAALVESFDGSRTARSEVSGKERRSSLARLAQVFALVLAFFAGTAPRAIGQWLEPYDAYNEQFSWSLDTPLLSGHCRILFLDCLPRLVAGHRLPGLEADPDPALMGTGGPIQKSTPSREAVRWWALLLTILALGFFAAAILALGATSLKGRTIGLRIIAAGMLAQALGVAGGFLVNRNIFNSDNYRYLVMLLIPWAIGCGLVLRGAVRLGGFSRWGGVALTLAMVALSTCDAAAWYRRLGWVNERLLLIRQRIDDPALRWLADHPEIGSIFGGYWDVYRLSFLSDGKVKGVPYPLFPNRFPEWSSGLPDGRPETLLARRSPDGQLFLTRALSRGGTVMYREGAVTIVNWPWPMPASSPR